MFEKKYLKINGRVKTFLIILLIVTASFLSIVGINVGSGSIADESRSTFRANTIISTDTTWTEANSPYNLSGNVLVEHNAALTIAPGVVVRLSAGNYFQVEGKLIAEGTATKMITFTSLYPNPATNKYWDSIRFLNNANTGSSIKYCNFEYSNGGILVAEVSSGQAPNITHSNISPSGIIYIIKNAKLPSADPANIISNNKVENGIHINILQANISIENNIIYNGIDCTVNVGNLNINNNSISGAQDALWCRNSWNSYLNITNNLIAGNTNRGVSFGTSANDGLDKIIIENNTIIYNKYGIDFLGTPNKINITYNTIRDNEFGFSIPMANTYDYFFNANNIYNNSKYNVKNVVSKTWGDWNFKNNWWGTTNATKINQSIYDFYNDFNFGKVIYKPFLTSEVNISKPYNLPPVAVAGPGQHTIVDETVYFDASKSYDPNNVIVNGMWDFGDGNSSNWATNISFHTYTIPGNYTVTLTVFDGLLYDTDTCYANVSIFIIPNAPPSVFIPDLEIYEDSYYTIDLWDKASDDRTPVEKLNFTILNISDPKIGVTLVSNRYISIKPTVNWFGNSTVTVQVSDGELTGTTTFNVIVIPVREPPWANAGGDLYVKLNQTVFFDGSGTMDSDGDILTYNWSFGDSTYTGWQNNSNASHSYNKTGKYKVKLSVSDSEFIDIDIIYVRVYANNTSKAPIIFDIPDIFIHYYGPEMSYDYFGYNYDFSYFIEDQDNKPEELTIWAEPFEQELSEYILPDENNSLGLIFKFPFELVDGNKHQISLFVGDLNPRTNEIYKSFNITVVSDVWPVELIAPFDKLELNEDFVRVDNAFTLSEHFYDRDSVNSYVIFNRMDNNIKAEIDDEMNIDIYTNQENFTGEEEILIAAHDEQPEQDLYTFLRIKVNPINDPPGISDIPIQIIKVNEENTLDLKDYIFDSDNSNSELLIDSSDPDHITINGSELVINYDTIGDKKVTLSVNDGEFTVTYELIISVIEDDGKPITGEDSDGDGLPDAWELKYGLDPNDGSDANLDFDNDSLTNLEEYIKNTDPTNYDTDGDGYSDKVDEFPNDSGNHKKESEDEADKPPIQLENVIAIILVVIVIIILLILSFITKNKHPSKTTFTPDDEVYSKVVHDILYEYQSNGDKLSSIEMKTILDEKLQNGEISQESHNHIKNLLDNMEQLSQENNK